MIKRNKSKVNALFRFKSLRTSILIPFIILVTSTVLTFMMISLLQSRDSSMDTTTEYTTQLIKMANSDIDSYFLNMENIANILMNNSDTAEYLEYTPEEHTKGLDRQCEIRLENQFRTLRESRDDIYNIGILGIHGNYLINNQYKKMNPYANVQSKEWYTRALNGEESIVYSHVQNIVDGEYPWVVTLSRAIVDDSTGETLGVIFIDMNYHSISSLCEEISLGSKGYIFIIDENGNIVYHPKQQLLYSGVQTEEIQKIMQRGNGSFYSKNGEKVYTVSRSELTGCTIVGVSYLSELMEKIDGLQELYIILAIILIFIAVIISVIIANMISRPIRDLGDSMKQVDQENFDIHIENPGYTNVIGDLIHSFNIMIERIRELIQRITDEQTEKRKSELSALQAQINPHFLYNTLDSIIWMAESHKIPEVVEMTSALSKLLRKSISNDNEIVTVSDEISYVSEYLKIQKMRYRDKLDFSINVDHELLMASMPKLIMQPLVENAIYHGIKMKKNGGVIRIEGHRRDNMMELLISDDGVGMDAHTMEHLLDERDKEQNNGKKVGVNNVNRRIKLYFGNEFGLRYESIQSQGTIVHVDLPYMMKV